MLYYACDLDFISEKIFRNKHSATASETTRVFASKATFAQFRVHPEAAEKCIFQPQQLKKKRRIVCSRGRDKRGENVWKCKKCCVALHLKVYFEVYHTQYSF